MPRLATRNRILSALCFVTVLIFWFGYGSMFFILTVQRQFVGIHQSFGNCTNTSDSDLMSAPEKFYDFSDWVKKRPEMDDPAFVKFVRCVSGFNVEKFGVWKMEADI